MNQSKFELNIKLLLLPLPVWVEGAVLCCLFVCLFICLFITKLLFKLNYISISKQAVALKGGNPRQTVVCYKIGKFFQAQAYRV